MAVLMLPWTINLRYKPAKADMAYNHGYSGLFETGAMMEEAG
jgi:hypothetical protein